jgi:cytoskeletal protein CcmA (bactofilin family)
MARDSLRVQTWAASGAVKVLGNVEVESATVSGNVSIGGALDAGELRSAGRFDVFDAVRVRTRLQVRGEATLRGSVDAGDLDAAGTVRVTGPVRARGLVHYAGTFELAGPLTAARLVGNGTIQVAGPVEATEVELGLERACRIGSLRADRVRVTRRTLLPLPIPGFPMPTLTVARIDAKEVELEGVVCEVLQADRITLGPGCRIAHLDGQVVARHSSARVGPESRSPAPYGLTR